MHEFGFISGWFFQQQPLISFRFLPAKHATLKNKSKNNGICLHLHIRVTSRQPENSVFGYPSCTQNVDSMSCWTSCRYRLLSVNMSINLPVMRGGMCARVFVTFHFPQCGFTRSFGKHIREARRSREQKGLNIKTISLWSWCHNRVCFEKVLHTHAEAWVLDQDDLLMGKKTTI